MLNSPEKKFSSRSCRSTHCYYYLTLPSGCYATPTTLRQDNWICVSLSASVRTVELTAISVIKTVTQRIQASEQNASDVSTSNALYVRMSRNTNSKLTVWKSGIAAFVRTGHILLRFMVRVTIASMVVVLIARLIDVSNGYEFTCLRFLKAVPGHSGQCVLV
ncbi:hypothetical protein MPH_06680 [Macrophomina phaseolina MS6]|uniref:Uncharacterized protein n=1 Tax=Macrophomina phaseolina (strain MS6) TaxID=1126212 RepID=K2S0T2_MACPH|nr:hypothetical protein MPH_06680 [Macrophomina phaseolina MS6]